MSTVLAIMSMSLDGYVADLNDGVAEGAVMDGYKKVIYTSPFGKSCGWERVR